MKIVSVMTTTSRGGAEFAAVEMLDALAARGHETVMVSDQPAIGRGTRVAVAPIAIGPKLAVRTWPGLLLRWPLLRRRLRAALREQSPYDVLLVHYKKEQLLAPGLPRELRPALVWCEWGPVPFPMRKGLPNRAYRNAGEAADLVLAISHGTLRNVIETGIPAEKVVYVANAVRTDDIAYSDEGRARVRERLGIPADAFVVGCISRFHSTKRNDVLVDAVKLLDDERAHLVLAGSGETEAALRELGAPLGERLHVIDTPGGDVGDVLSAFDVSVFCPSPTEGQPRAVILGMLARRPCLSTGAEGVSDMITPDIGAITSPENDAPALAAELRARFDDPERRAREGDAARAVAERVYAAPVVAQRLEELLQGAIAQASEQHTTD